jgi:hypothetical protein
MTLSEEIINNNILLIIISKEKYNESLTTIQTEIEKSANKIGYITLNKPFNSVIENLTKNNLNKDKFFFVDAITATVQAPPVVDNCIFVSSPTALTDLGLAFSSLLTEHNCEIVFLDTVSTLAVYQDAGSVTKFVHNLVTKVRVLNKKAVFLAVKEDSETLIKDLNMFVDKIVEL